MKVTASQIKKIRDKTGAPIARVKEVLIKEGEKRAVDILKKEGFKRAAKRVEKETSQGAIKAYVHHSGKIVGVVELLCETDFVAKNNLFQKLANDLAMQVASMDPKDATELEGQDFIKDPKKKVLEVVKEVVAKTGENIRIGRIFRVELGR